MPESLATGRQLALRLTHLVGDLLAGEIPASVGRPLTLALDEAEAKRRCQATLAAAVAAMQGAGCCSRWQLAQRLSVALRRFEGVGRQRVAAGVRPATPFEQALVVLLETAGPRCAHSLWREMRGFD